MATSKISLKYFCTVDEMEVSSVIAVGHFVIGNPLIYVVSCSALSDDSSHILCCS